MLCVYIWNVHMKSNDRERKPQYLELLHESFFALNGVSVSVEMRFLPQREKEKAKMECCKRLLCINQIKEKTYHNSQVSDLSL